MLFVFFILNLLQNTKYHLHTIEFRKKRGRIAMDPASYGYVRTVLIYLFTNLATAVSCALDRRTK